jgi:hypothetical protein
MSPGEDRFTLAARAYLAYGVVYLVGGAYLVYHGVGVGDPQTPGRLPSVLRSVWVLVGLVLVVVIPYLLRRRRRWFERWVLSRRDFARILALFMALRAVQVARIALRSESGSVPAPWGGVISFQVGAVVFLVITLAALVFVALAAWSEPSP